MAKTYFDLVMCSVTSSSNSIRFQDIHMPRLNLADLDAAFSEEAVWEAIKIMPNEKSPTPDGFTGLFYQKCWEIIKQDVMAALHKFCSGIIRTWSCLTRQSLLFCQRRRPHLS